MKKVIITGCFGHMGKELAKLTRSHNLELVAGICTPERLNDHTNFKIGSNLNDFINLSDVVIDFTTPDSAINFARICATNNKAFISGTTGFTPLQYKELSELAKQIPIFISPNMSIGVAKFSRILSYASKLLIDDYDVEILEMHHNQKTDAPSGTAKMLGEVVSHAYGVNLNNAMSLDRNHKRRNGEIGFASIRGGNIVGEHHVIFAGNDVITLSHKAINRKQFAQGALLVAPWIASQAPGKLYSMDDYI